VFPKARPITVAVLLSVGLSSCAEKDSEPPIVTIAMPSEHARFAVLDTIEVIYSVSDDRMVERATVKLVNADMVPVGTHVAHDIGKPSHSGHAELVVSDRQLASGKYYVTVTATDGVNERSAFRLIHIDALPLARRAVYITDHRPNGQGAVSRIDSLFSSITPVAGAGQDIGRVWVNSAHDRVTVSGTHSPGMMQYRLPGAATAWATTVPKQSGAPAFHDMTGQGDHVFASLFTRELRGHDLNGSLILNRQYDHDRPHTLFADADHLFVELREVGGGQRRLQVLRRMNFSEKWIVSIPMEMAAICPRNSTEVFIFGNDGGQARVLLYDTGNNGHWEPRQLPDGPVLHAVRGEGQNWFIAHATGLYHYTYNPNYLNLIRPGAVYQRLCFDRVDGLLLGASGSRLDVMTGLTGNVVASLTHTDSISDLHIHYTK
jgi:hypothetical protein